MASYPGLVRELINEALTEEEIRDLCFDHFRPVYDTLSAAMSRAECIRRLVSWCYQHQQMEFLLNQVKDLNASIYEKYAPNLEQIEDKYPPKLPAETTKHLSPNIIHPLPPAPAFVGRKRELEALQQFWTHGNPGVFSLIGLGGAGKTAITAEFINRLLTGTTDSPDGLFVWSFYINQDANAFLETAFLYFSDGGIARGSGLGTFYLLLNLLSKTNKYLIVMDGLERVQRPQSDTFGTFGDLTDPLLSQIVTRMAAGLGYTKCLITSRFPLMRLEPWRGKSYQSLDVDQLENEDARLLLRKHGIKGDNAALDDLIEDYGAHALTLDHLGGYLQEYYGGNAAYGKILPEPQTESFEVQERRLARVLYAYEKALSERELELLSRLCIFRFGTTAERLQTVFSTSDNPLIVGSLKDLTIRDFNNILKHLSSLHLVLPEAKGEYSAHPAIRDHFYRSFTDPRILHHAVRQLYSSLVGAPGLGLPDSNYTIDLLEELLYHTLQAGTLVEAKEIYFQRLGRYIHLAWNLGQYSRCIRILKEFPQCPDPSGLIWCYRAVGDLNAALSLIDPDDTWWLGMIGCLRGYLKEVAVLLAFNRQDPICTITEFLTGGISLDALHALPVWNGLPITPADCYLQVDMIEQARACVIASLNELADSRRGLAWHDEIARYDLIMAEIERRSANYTTCRGLLEKATQWIVQSGSQEHLCLLHYGKARLAMDEEHFDLARSMINEGLHIAEQCGFGLYGIELLIERSRLSILTRQISDATRSALAALNGILKGSHEPASEPGLDESELLILGANHPKCQFIWGSVKAGYLYGQSLLLSGETIKGKKSLEETLILQKRIADPGASETEKLLSTISD